MIFSLKSLKKRHHRLQIHYNPLLKLLKIISIKLQIQYKYFKKKIKAYKKVVILNLIQKVITKYIKQTYQTNNNDLLIKIIKN